MTLLILLVLWTSRAQADSHSLRYYKTKVSSPVSGLPEYSVVGYVDDQDIVDYNRDTGQCQPRGKWMKELGDDYWDESRHEARVCKASYTKHMQLLMNIFNQTGGFHILQVMYGCELRDDGSTAGYDQYGYDGRDLMYLDTQSGIYIPTMNEAQIITQGWNSPEVRYGEIRKNYLEVECIQLLTKHISREVLERRVRPEVKVRGRESEGVLKLQCLAYGFYPRAVDVKWVRNEVDEVLSLEGKTILPHPDGTYQLRVTVEVPVREEDSYSCHVDHSSLEEILKVKWEPDNGRRSDVIVIVIAGLAALATVITGVAFCIRKKCATRASDANSDSTNSID